MRALRDAAPLEDFSQRIREMLRRRSLVLVAICAVTVVVVAASGYRALHAVHAATAFAPLIDIVNRRDFAPVPLTTQRVPSGARLVVLVRDVTARSGTLSDRYFVRDDFSWDVPAAHSYDDAGVALLVDRIELDVRSYFPIGEDRQIILHCTLLDVPAMRLITSFTFRGSIPSPRQGVLAAAGLLAHHGSEPWPQVRRRVEAQLSAPQLMR
jgi:hypothetical protein